MFQSLSRRSALALVAGLAGGVVFSAPPVAAAESLK